MSSPLDIFPLCHTTPKPHRRLSSCFLFPLATFLFARLLVLCLHPSPFSHSHLDHGPASSPPPVSSTLSRSPTGGSSHRHARLVLACIAACAPRRLVCDRRPFPASAQLTSITVVHQSPQDLRRSLFARGTSTLVSPSLRVFSRFVCLKLNDLNTCAIRSSTAVAAKEIELSWSSGHLQALERRAGVTA